MRPLVAMGMATVMVACSVREPGAADPIGPGAPAAPTGPADPWEPTGPANPGEPTGPECTEVTLEPAPADWLLLVDTSGSWEGRLDRWEGLGDGLADFLEPGRPGLGLAMSTFPRPSGADEDSCVAADYRTLELPWGASAEAAVEHVDAAPIGGGSTLGPALEGALREARAHQQADPGRSTTVVLLTDATPGDDETCAASDWPLVAEVAGQAFSDGVGPSVHTSVVSVIGTAVSPDHFGRLGQIAVDGGGFAAFVNGSRADVARSTAQALTDLYDRAATCTLLLPEGVVPEALTLTFADGEVLELSRAPTAAECDLESFTLDDPTAPRTATLCSGEGGVGGLCELAFVRARVEGAPTVTTRCLD